MQCRHCGTEIADKALICYRCGAATTDPQFKPPAPARGTRWTLIVALVVLLIAICVGIWLAFGRQATPGTTGQRDPITQSPITRSPDHPITRSSYAA
jgi:hypothetical protein